MKTTPVEVLACNEWDFRKIPAEELAAATFYEYARESVSVRALVGFFAETEGHLRKQVEEQCSLHGYNIGAQALAEVGKLDCVPYWNCILWPEFFPAVPWQGIPSESRRARIKHYQETRPPIALVTINDREAPLEKWETPRRNGRAFGGSDELLIVTVNWAKGNNRDIVAAFADWVGRSRPKWLPEPRGKSSRENVNVSYLTRLGVMRLLNAHRYEEAAEIARKARFYLPEQLETSKIRQRVSIDLRALFCSDSFERNDIAPIIPKKEKPLHFATARRAEKLGSS